MRSLPSVVLYLRVHTRSLRAAQVFALKSGQRNDLPTVLIRPLTAAGYTLSINIVNLSIYSYHDSLMKKSFCSPSSVSRTRPGYVFFFFGAKRNRSNRTVYVTSTSFFLISYEGSTAGSACIFSPYRIRLRLFNLDWFGCGCGHVRTRVPPPFFFYFAHTHVPATAEPGLFGFAASSQWTLSLLS